MLVLTGLQNGLVSSKMKVDFLNEATPVNIGGALVSLVAVVLLMFLLYKNTSIKRG